MQRTELDSLESSISGTILSVTGRKVQADAMTRAMEIIGANLIKPGSDVFPPWKPDPVYTDGQRAAQWQRIAYLERLREFNAAEPGSRKRRDASRQVNHALDLMEETAYEYVERGDCGEFIYPNGFTFPLEDTGAVVQACRDHHHGQGCHLYILQCDLDNACPSRLRYALATLRQEVEHLDAHSSEEDMSAEELGDLATYHQAIEDLTRWSEGASAPLKDSNGNAYALVGYDRCECGCKYWDNDQCHSCNAPHFSLKLDQEPGEVA